MEPVQDQVCDNEIEEQEEREPGQAAQREIRSFRLIVEDKAYGPEPFPDAVPERVNDFETFDVSI